MPVAGPYYLAWVDAGVAFDADVHNVMDEYVFSIKRMLAEGDKPYLEIEIRNPHVGLLNVSRKQWAWISRCAGGVVGNTIEPFFYGRLTVLPNNAFAEVITLRLVSWPVDYFEQFQRLAEEVRVGGVYDPIFIQPSKRDDPDTILLADTKLVHVDPVTLAVSLSDVVVGEDGDVVFTADDHFYDGMVLEEMEQKPLTAVRMDATVSWHQTARGFVDMGNETIFSYGWDGIVDEWPKPLAQLGAGWSVQYSIATEVTNIRSALIGSASFNWTNPAREHNDGDSLSLSVSVSSPQLLGSYQSAILTERNQSGVLDPFAVDEDGDPSPLNIPPSYEATHIYCPLGQVNTSLVLRYDADRPRTERVVMLLTADLQEVIVDPLVTQVTEFMTETGTDVGVPIIDLLNWTTVSGQSVSVGDVVFPDLPTLPGGRSAQVCTTPGTAGATQPNFSDVVGVTTADNDVVWSSLGIAGAPETATDWTADSRVPLGEIVLPRIPLYTSWLTALQPGLAQFPQVGVGIALGQIVQGSNGYFFSCTLDGVTDTVEPIWPASFGSTIVDGSVTWTCIGGVLPDGKTHYIATASSAVTGALYVLPPFGAHAALHDSFVDGGVTWTSIGTGDIPAGGTPGNVTASSYWPTARGRKSLEYLIGKMRAKMLYRARAVRAGFETTWDKGKTTTLRKNATLHDSRLQGGQVIGKVIGHELSIVGDTGVENCRITIGVCVGKSNVVVASAGTPSYVSGYVTGYRSTNADDVVLFPSSDVGYTPPIAATGDDGLRFPLDRSQVVISDAVIGTVAAQEAGIRSAFASAARAAQLAQINPGTVAQSIVNQQIEALASANSVPRNLQRNPIYKEIQLKPVNSGPVFDVYNVQLTSLVAPKGIDFSAGSTP